MVTLRQAVWCDRKVTWPHRQMWSIFTSSMYLMRELSRTIMLLTKTYFCTFSPAQALWRAECKLPSTSKKNILMSLTFANETRKQTTESLEQCLGLIQSLLSAWKGRVIPANAQISHVCKHGGADKALPSKPPLSPGIHEQLVSITWDA